MWLCYKFPTESNSESVLKSVNIWWSYGQELGVLFFLTHSVVYLRTYRHLSRTVLNCIDSCECEHYLRISEQICLMLMTYWHWLSTSKLHDFLRFLFSCQSSVFRPTHLSHTVLNCIVSHECDQYVRIPEQRCLMLVTCLTVCPLKQYVRF